MSADVTVYLGPYLRIHNPPMPTTEVRRTCPTVQCEKHAEAIWDENVKFCPVCGSAIEEVTFPANAGIYFDFHEGTNGALRHILEDFESQQGSVFVVSDLEDGPGESFDPTRSLYVSEDITLERMQNDMRMFEHQFSSHIQKIKGVFGESAVELKWGLLSNID